METKRIPEDFKVFEESSGPFNQGDFLVFKLRKTNYSTEDAVQHIASSLRIDRKQIGYAGAKDSKAITEQFITIVRVPKDRVESLKLRDIELTYAGRSQKALSLGDLSGNRFEITVRKIMQKPEPIKQMLNLFGEQRFSTDNALIGRLIVKKDFKGAVETMLFHDGRQEEAIRAHLEKSKKDYVGALKKLPWKTLQLYVHAYQSHIWNRCAQRAEGIESMPIAGFSTELEGEVGAVVSSVLDEEGVELNDFVIRQIPELSSSGSTREVKVEIKDLSIGELEDDDLNPGFKKVKISFKLPKGSYATQAVKELFKHQLP